MSKIDEYANELAQILKHYAETGEFDEERVQQILHDALAEHISSHDFIVDRGMEVILYSPELTSVLEEVLTIFVRLIETAYNKVANEIGRNYKLKFEKQEDTKSEESVHIKATLLPVC